MSIVYEKSTDPKYKRYFSQTNELTQKYYQYSINTQKISPADGIPHKPWETGKAGIPISWIPSKKAVVIDHTDSHSLIIGPTGSKKSRLIAMPMIRILGSSDAMESMIISDPKAELYARTAKYLEQNGYEIMVLNLRSPMYGDCWNPLEIPYKFFCAGEVDRACEFVNDIAENLIHNNKSVNEPFWDNSAGSFFFGLTLLLFKYCKEHNKGSEYVHIANIIRLRNILLSRSKMQTAILQSPLWNYAKTDNIISASLIGTVETATDTRGGILSTFDQKMRNFSIQPNLLDMLSNNTINLDMFEEKPTVVFLILPDEKTGYHNLASLFIKQSYEYIIFKAQQSTSDVFSTGKLNRRINYILDEFSSLPTISDLPSMITASRSRNIRFTLFVQSKHQMLQRYSKETETIQTNCNNWLFLTSRELQLLEEISSLCGNTSGSLQKPVLSVSALQRLDKETGEALLLSGRSLPYVTHLPDIDEYDKKQFEVRAIDARKQKSLSLLSFDLPNQEKSDVASSKPFSKKIDVDALIADIDKQLAELDKEEQKNKAKLRSENKEGDKIDD